MNRHHQFAEGDLPTVCHCCISPQFLHKAALVYIQAADNLSSELQRMKLRLIPEPDRPHSGEREFHRLRQLCRKPNLPQRLHLLFQLVPVLKGIHIRILSLKITAYPLTELRISFHGSLICLQYDTCPLRPHGFMQPLIEKSVLGRDLRCRIACNSRAHRVALQENIIHSCLLQKEGAQNSRHPASHNENLCLFFSLKLPKRRQPGILPPNRFHNLSPFQTDHPAVFI